MRLSHRRWNRGTEPFRKADVATHTEAFFLLEAMLAVAIFAIGVLALGKCMEQCLKAQMFKEEDSRARRILENKMQEIEAGVDPIGEKKTVDVSAFPGMKLTTTPVVYKGKNEKKEAITGIYDVTLLVTWPSGGETQSKSLEFYVFPRQ